MNSLIMEEIEFVWSVLWQNIWLRTVRHDVIPPCDPSRMT